MLTKVPEWPNLSAEVLLARRQRKGSRKGGQGSRHRPSGRNLGSHHIRPTSRGGGDVDNQVTVPGHFHECWHHVFGILTLDEAKIFMDEVMRPDRRWTCKQLEALRKIIMDR